MWGVTAWVLATWLRWPFCSPLAVADRLVVARRLTTAGSCCSASPPRVAELYVTRALVREWCSEARLSWWWSP